MSGRGARIRVVDLREGWKAQLSEKYRRIGLGLVWSGVCEWPIITGRGGIVVKGTQVGELWELTLRKQ